MIAEHRRIGSVDGRAPHSERNFEPNLSIFRVERQHREPRFDEDMPLAVDGGGNRRRVAGVLAADLPEGLPRFQGKGDNSRPRLRTADVHDDLVPFDDGSAPRPEITLQRTEVLVRVARPLLPSPFLSRKDARVPCAPNTMIRSP